MSATDSPGAQAERFIMEEFATPYDNVGDSGFFLTAIVKADDRTVEAGPGYVKAAIPMPTVEQDRDAFNNIDNFFIVEWKMTGDEMPERKEYPLIEWLVNLSMFGTEVQQRQAQDIGHAIVNRLLADFEAEVEAAGVN